MRSLMRKVAFVGMPDGSVAEALREHGYRLDAVPAESIVGLTREIHALRPAAVHAREGHFKAAVVARLFDVPLLLQVAREDVGTLTARAARLAARTLCGSVAVREALVAQGAPASTTCVLRSLLEMKAGQRAAIVLPAMLDPGLRWVVAASPCDGPDRGHQDLLLAFASVARTRPRLRLLIAGDGSCAEELRSQAAAAGLRGRVVVHPVRLDQLPSLFARAAVVVGPSRGANSPDPVPEALAVGAPVVATAVGQHPTWIREGRTGWLVPPRAPVALAARLAQVVDDAEGARKVAENAQKGAVEIVAPHSVAQELARCYAAVSRLPSQPFAGIYIPAARRLSRA